MSTATLPPIVGHERMSRLCESFPSLRCRPGVRPWDQHAFAKWAGSAVSSGEQLAAAFVLGVWNGSSVQNSEVPLWFQEEYGVVQFDAVYAIGIWDHAHAQAFVDWCRAPFWP